MQFLAVAFVGIIGVFLAVLILPGIAQSIQAFPDTLSAGYSGTLHNNQIDSSEGQVLGETVEVKEFFLPEQTVATTLKEIPGVSRFQGFFNSVEGERFLTEPMLYTLFVPTDDAFDGLAHPQRVTLNTMNDDESQRFVMHHIVPQKMVAVTSSLKAGTVTALSRDVLNFELRKNGGTVGNAAVVATYNVGDGIIYVIDGVLFPPTPRFQ